MMEIEDLVSEIQPVLKANWNLIPCRINEKTGLNKQHLIPGKKKILENGGVNVHVNFQEDSSGGSTYRLIKDLETGHIEATVDISSKASDEHQKYILMHELAHVQEFIREIEDGLYDGAEQIKGLSDFGGRVIKGLLGGNEHGKRFLKAYEEMIEAAEKTLDPKNPEWLFYCALDLYDFKKLSDDALTPPKGSKGMKKTKKGWKAFIAGEWVTFTKSKAKKGWVANSFSNGDVYKTLSEARAAIANDRLNC